ncbi:glycosyltransferase family 2 protein [Gelidibacter sediminis]|uniref:glycosyltransferase family 2 protein n=1 Tax=Gelidibacter sediminis TaxID=1608710 RepID=UPI001FB9A85B|nr:glycosyltransferase family A protein [Gelidibacter sediminis]
MSTNVGATVFPIVACLPEEVVKQLQWDEGYTSQLAKDYDLSYQAVQLGYIGVADTYTDFESVSIRDNYHFIRKHFHPAWVFYVMLMRIVTHHNPIKELRAWWQTSSVNRSVSNLNPLVYPEWQSYTSNLIAQQPLVSVIIPTLNRYEYLSDVLKGFEKQDYGHFEIIVVDQSEPFQSDFYNNFDLNLRVIRQDEKALWLARNRAIQKAKGAFIALSEDDVRIQPDWISTHLKVLDFFKAQVSAGVFYPEEQSIPKERSYFALATQFATGNAMLYKSVFEKVGLFDRQFEKQRMGDGEFGLRVYLAGIKSVSNPYASCIDVKAGTGGLREMGSWDAFRPSSFFAPRPIPSVLYYFRKYYGNSAARWALLRTIPLSIMPYQFKKNKPLLLIGVLLSILLLPVVLVQVMRSWRLASEKLKEGDRIERLEIED